MRTVVLSVLALAVAFAVAVVGQVLIGQSQEAGSFGDRIATVLDRQFGGGAGPTAEIAAASPPAVDALAPASGLPPQLEALSRSTAEYYAEQTRADIAHLKADLLRDASDRDRESFWTDVRLNTLFLLLGIGVPVLFGRMTRALK